MSELKLYGALNDGEREIIYHNLYSPTCVCLLIVFVFISFILSDFGLDALLDRILRCSARFQSLCVLWWFLFVCLRFLHLESVGRLFAVLKKVCSARAVDAVSVYEMPCLLIATYYSVAMIIIFSLPNTSSTRSPFTVLASTI